ncbi:chromate efflux transporter [Aeromonas simiae]|uniref:chromate efflux transporter n=1 Tax=Aeromonas simiae TaxID=218936 RepID=UPI00266CCBF0|nr:chromate efflux transporter [Aeromonas simiae]MDO2950351.1 chromate efflux transporter [Aeromonas simiae]MDO2954058.1 chromate efflux transporter [Aeromonas simiae]MDO2957773.1 chromate efflux transporter [Aeromonas simiae]
MPLIFFRFLWLGCLGFGGPAAHIGLFRQAFVERLGWLSQEQFAHQLALCQFLPGPASSQLGFAIGRQRAGLPGALAAFIGFTLPSFILMVSLALLGGALLEQAWFPLLVHGLKLLALVVVMDAVLAMGRQFCTTLLHQGCMVMTAALLWLLPGLVTQFAMLLLCALVGGWRASAEPAPHTPGAPAWGWLAAFFLLLLLPPLLGQQLFADFYLTGSLVFGGGHVVLPLLQQTVGSQLGEAQFLSGYALAQLVPGPMFTLASYLGALANPAHPWLGALLATLGVFLPGFLLLLALTPLWHGLLSRPRWRAASAALNASVVGLLLAALYQPVFTSAVRAAPDLALAALGWFALRAMKVPLLPLAAGLVTLSALLHG